MILVNAPTSVVFNGQVLYKTPSWNPHHIRSNSFSDVFNFVKENYEMKALFDLVAFQNICYFELNKIFRFMKRIYERNIFFENFF